VEEESSIASSMLSVKSAHLWTFQGVSLHNKNILVFYVCEIRSFDTVPLWGLFSCDSNQKEILLRFVLVNQISFLNVLTAVKYSYCIANWPPFGVCYLQCVTEFLSVY